MTRINGRALMEKEFAPIKYIVPGIIPEGTSVLAAAPKIGKSWMVLGLALELSNGGNAFGKIPVGDRRPVLYFALEDGERRLQDRLISLNPEDVSDRIEFDTAIPDGQVVASIRDYLGGLDGQGPIVILDTLGRVMPPAGNAQQYGHDYRVMSALKAATDSVPGSSLLIVHHTRKSRGEDFLDAVSGTQGIAGAADTVLVLDRDRHDNRATLQVTSRDAAEGEYSLLLDERGRWSLDGASVEDAAERAAQARARAGVTGEQSRVIDVVSEHPDGITPAQLKNLLPDVKNVDEYLRRAVFSERIEKLGRGLYGPVRSVSLLVPDSQSHKLTQLTRCKGCGEPLATTMPGQETHPDLACEHLWAEKRELGMTGYEVA